MGGWLAGSQNRVTSRQVWLPLIHQLAVGSEAGKTAGGQAASSVSADCVGATKAGYQRWKLAARSSFRTRVRT